MNTSSFRAAAAVAVVTLCLAGCASVVVGSAQPGSAPPPTTVSSVPREISSKSVLEETLRVASLPESAALMAKFRAADLCLALDPEPLKKYGPKQSTAAGPGLTGCKIFSSDADPNAPTYRFEISTRIYTEIDRLRDRDVEERAGEHRVFRSEKQLIDSGCTYRLPIAESGYAFIIDGYKSSRQQGQKNTWADACADTLAYTGAIAAKLLSFPVRTAPPTGKSLLGKDPCAAQQQALAEFPGWTVDRVQRSTPYACNIILTKPGDAYSYDLGLDFHRNVEQAVSAETPAVTIAGLSGIRLNKNLFPGMPEHCALSLNYRPSEPKGTSSGHLIGVKLQPTKTAAGGTSAQSLSPCSVVDKVAAVVVQSAG
ncbi:hypothetical protein [Allokutzneria sp. NRRL B-24872]|uniref:hypothetical protein n=1 Tax=Allokutzneria sp. NRRL B-24872 TaxID=1137961 RepID=UPI000A395EFC|nr:hypothetical protein [Allokutzneria sp. NRRL B-24872]